MPELLRSPFEHSILKRAIDKKLIEINIVALREYGIGKHKQIDDYQYGGGAGLVIMPVPLHNCIEDLKSKHSYDEVIFVTPDGHNFNQSTANRLSLLNRVLIILGHYKGIDDRIREKHVTMELSIGDYVLSGGELPAAVIVDAVSRLIPGVLNDATSALTDSHQDNLLAPPVYTRPADFEGMKVPNVLLSGDDSKIDEWRYDQSLKKTQHIRPDLMED